VNGTRSNSKFVKIVDQIRQMISTDGLLAGDKLPSERELSERLSVGRSSVREALRALELLGLIETRRGEGTFLRDFHEHKLVELLSAFILQDAQKRYDVSQTKEIIEEGCLSLLIQQAGTNPGLEDIKKKLKAGEFPSEEAFFSALMDLSGNSLLKKIWMIVKDYVSIEDRKNRLPSHKEEFISLVESIESAQWPNVHKAYQALQKLSKDKR